MIQLPPFYKRYTPQIAAFLIPETPTSPETRVIIWAHLAGKTPAPGAWDTQVACYSGGKLRQTAAAVAGQSIQGYCPFQGGSLAWIVNVNELTGKLPVPMLFQLSAHVFGTQEQFQKGEFPLP